MTDLYKNIKNRRIELNMTQTELAKKVGYADKGMISRVENGKVDLSQSQIMKFAEALSTDPAVLMGWDVLFEKTKSLPILDVSTITNDQIPTLPDLINLGDRKEAHLIEYAKRLYEKYQAASPEIQQAVDLLLKTDKQD